MQFQQGFRHLIQRNYMNLRSKKNRGEPSVQCLAQVGHQYVGLVAVIHLGDASNPEGFSVQRVTQVRGEEGFVRPGS